MVLGMVLGYVRRARNWRSNPRTVVGCQAATIARLLFAAGGRTRVFGECAPTEDT
jgi:hypothetical protein